MKTSLIVAVCVALRVARHWSYLLSLASVASVADDYRAEALAGVSARALLRDALTC